jgi:hypothetical protein
MGSFYVNFTVKAEDPESVAQTLRRAGRKAFVSPDLSGYVVVTDQEADEQNPEAIQQVGELLSGALKTSVLAVLNHDDDILCYWLFENGSTTDEYNSAPGYFTGEDVQPSGGDAGRLCSVFGRKDALAEIKNILMDQGYIFVLDRHEALTNALELPAASVGFGFSYLEAGDAPEGIDPASLIQTP